MKKIKSSPRMKILSHKEESLRSFAKLFRPGATKENGEIKPISPLLLRSTDNLSKNLRKTDF